MKYNDIKVSIIVPVYNVEKFLRKCIDTILNQTHKNIEVILVNDGSLDDSGTICDEYVSKDNRIKVIHKENAGVSAARNSGIDVASGEYVCFVDGDDYVMPDYVEYMLNMVVDNDADISLTTEMFGNYTLNQVKKDNIEVWTGEDATIGILCYRIPIGVYCKIFKRDFLGCNIRFLTNLFIGEGFNFNTTAFQHANKVVVGNRRIYYYRRDNPTSATTKFSINKWENGLMAINIIKENFIIKSKEVEKAWQYAYWRTHSDVYDLIILASVEKEYPDMYKKCLSVTRRQAMCSLNVPTSKKERVRAMVMMVYPKIIPQMMIWRRMKYHIDLDN